MKEKRFYVYISTNYPRKTVLYIGVTSNILKRDFEHKDKMALKSFTAKYNINRIVYYELYGDPLLAINREKQMKRLLRLKKIELINKDNPEWNDLVDEMMNN